MAALLFITFYFLFIAGPLVLMSLVAVEVLSTYRRGQWCTWYTIGLLAVVSLTLLMLIAFYDMVVQPFVPWSPMECCAIFSVWATAFVWWHAMILKEVRVTRPKPVGEAESVLRRRIAELLAKHLHGESGKEATDER